MGLKLKTWLSTSEHKIGEIVGRRNEKKVGEEGNIMCVGRRFMVIHTISCQSTGFSELK